jgi:hypothetical protein
MVQIPREDEQDVRPPRAERQLWHSQTAVPDGFDVVLAVDGVFDLEERAPQHLASFLQLAA